MKDAVHQIINSVSEFTACIDKFRTEQGDGDSHLELIFRGQPVDKPLLPKIARLPLRLKKDNIIHTEKLILEEFKMGLQPLAEFRTNNNWDALALAQHHGLPTRLLDWSYNALAALWFAVERPPQADEKGTLMNGVVYILTAEADDFRIDTHKSDPLDNKITKIFRSNIVSRRISAQTGLFTVHLINDKGKIFQFETNKNFKDKLTKLVIPSEKFVAIRKQLSLLGVNNFTVFPDLDGFCKHLQSRFFLERDEQE